MTGMDNMPAWFNFGDDDEIARAVRAIAGIVADAAFQAERHAVSSELIIERTVRKRMDELFNSIPQLVCRPMETEMQHAEFSHLSCTRLSDGCMSMLAAAQERISAEMAELNRQMEERRIAAARTKATERVADARPIAQEMTRVYDLIAGRSHMENDDTGLHPGGAYAAPHDASAGLSAAEMMNSVYDRMVGRPQTYTDERRRMQAEARQIREAAAQESASEHAAEAEARRVASPIAQQIVAAYNRAIGRKV